MINKWAYIRVGYIFGGGGPYIWNEVSVSTCGGLIHGGGLIFEGAYIQRFTVYGLVAFITVGYNSFT